MGETGGGEHEWDGGRGGLLIEYVMDMGQCVQGT